MDGIGKNIKVMVNKPVGSRHPNHRDICYHVNYGYIKDIEQKETSYEESTYDHIIIGSLRFSPYMHRHMYGRI